MNITPEGNSDADASAAFQFPGSGGGRPKKKHAFSLFFPAQGPWKPASSCQSIEFRNDLTYLALLSEKT